MNPQRGQWLLLTTVLLVYACLLQWIWLRHQSLSGLLLLFSVTLPLLAFSSKPSAPLGEVQDNPRPFQDFTALPARGDLVLAAVGLAAIAVALKLALTDHLGWCLGALLLAGICWRSLLDTRDSAVSPKATKTLLAIALVMAAIFRLYKAGDIPEGMITVDEPRITSASQLILDGSRETYITSGIMADGSIPFYMQALGMKIFGSTLTGFRMGSIASGWLVVLLIAFVGAELAGASIGLAAAFMAAMAYWPVSFSRAEYLVSASYLPMLSCIGLFLYGLRRNKTLILVLAGFSMGFCFNVYQPGKLVPLLVALLALGLWLQHEKWRPALQASWLPLTAGLAAGLAPLVLWIVHDPKGTLPFYFHHFSTEFIAGSRAVHEQNLLTKLDLMTGQILPQLGKVAGFFTVRGAIRPWFIGVDNTLIDKATLGLMLSGIAVCLARFKRPGYAFLPLWWLIGLLPTLMADPGANLDERRVMLSLPPTMLLAGCGLVSLLELSSLGLATRLSQRWSLAAGLCFFIFYGATNWNFYFNVINKNDDYLTKNHANFDNALRAILRENNKSPVYLINTHKPQMDYWQSSSSLDELGEHAQLLHHIPRITAAEDPDYIKNGGLFGALDGRNIINSNRAYFESASFLGGAKGARYDPLIVLTPFHFYLEPMLVSQLGGVRVAELPLAKGDKGVNLVDIGMYYDPAIATRVIRLPNFDHARLKPLQKRWEYPYIVEELLPPGTKEKRAFLAKQGIYTSEAQAALRDYAHEPSRWSAGRKSQFSMADPWFWIRAGGFPAPPGGGGEITFPLRLRASWGLKIPADGTYRLGASANIYTSLRLGRPGRRAEKVFLFIPEDLQKNNDARGGLWGEPLKLKAGDYRLDMEQVMLSTDGNYNHILRLVWQTPGGQKETLPLEYLYPDSADMEAPQK
jgi:4-amino-4-deoxy-L-arabinose transferase-like glycosyltransferase